MTILNGRKIGQQSRERSQIEGADAGSILAMPAVAPRLAVVDGLRAVAAPMVAWLHIHATSQGLTPLLPAAVNAFSMHLGLGVQIFFVVSGFAIAQSLAGITPGLAIFGRFILRRIIRLDPPFWVSMALALVVYRLAEVMMHQPVKPWPKLSLLLAHPTYTMPFFGGKFIMDVYWTLMVEFQFYLVFFFLTWLGHFLSGWNRALNFVPVLAMTVWAWGVRFGGWPIPHDGLVLWQHWHVFVLGIACSYLHQKRWPSWSVPALCMATVAVSSLPVTATAVTALRAIPTSMDLAFYGLQLSIGDVAGLGTAMFLWLAFQRSAQERWLAHPAVQWMAGISYSLYLLHPLFGQRLGNILYRILGTSGAIPIFVSLISMALSILAAWVLCRLVERPAMNLARRIPRQP